MKKQNHLNLSQSNESDLMAGAHWIAADGKVRSVLDGRLRELNKEVIPLPLEDLDPQPARSRFVLAGFPFAPDVFSQTRVIAPRAHAHRENPCANFRTIRLRSDRGVRIINQEDSGCLEPNAYGE
jgi:hypothetical protein